MFLDVYFGEQLVNAASSGRFNFLEAISNSALFYFLLVFIFFFLLFIFFFFVKPLFKKSPKAYYERYLYIRDQLKKIDDLFVNKKIDFEDYTYAQFNYAKEYEKIVSYLSKIPEFKSKLQSYDLACNEESSSQTKESNKNNLSKEDLENLKKISLLIKVLQPQVKYYTREEIKQAILDENFSKKIAENVVERFDKLGLKFGVSSKQKINKFSSFINKVFDSDKPISSKTQNKAQGTAQNQKGNTLDETTTSTSYNKHASDKIDIRQAISSNNFDDSIRKSLLREDIDKMSFKHPKKEEVPKSLFSNIFKSKKKVKVEEINDIFKDIQKSLDK